jgi:putative FmdB family regulatory protein
MISLRDGMRDGPICRPASAAALSSKSQGNEMPVYDYLCNKCGPFTDMRPIAECDAPQNCPRCAASSPRAILKAPNFLCMPSDRRKAFAINERSANAPRTLGESKASHAPGCGCCSGKPSRLVTKTRSGAKSFPTARPWMISH